MCIHLPHNLQYMLGIMNTWLDSKLLYAWSWDWCFDTLLYKLSSRGESKSFASSGCLMCLSLCHMYTMLKKSTMLVIQKHFRRCVIYTIGWSKLEIRVLPQWCTWISFIQLPPIDDIFLGRLREFGLLPLLHASMPTLHTKFLSLYYECFHLHFERILHSWLELDVRGVCHELSIIEECMWEKDLQCLCHENFVI